MLYYDFVCMPYVSTTIHTYYIRLKNEESKHTSHPNFWKVTRHIKPPWPQLYCRSCPTRRHTPHKRNKKNSKKKHTAATSPIHSFTYVYTRSNCRTTAPVRHCLRCLRVVINTREIATLQRATGVYFASSDRADCDRSDSTTSSE